MDDGTHVSKRGLRKNVIAHELNVEIHPWVTKIQIYLFSSQSVPFPLILFFALYEVYSASYIRITYPCNGPSSGKFWKVVIINSSSFSRAFRGWESVTYYEKKSSWNKESQE